MQKNNQNAKKMVQIALLLALESILSRFFSLATPIAKISFAFLPLAAIGILHGPGWGFAAGATADFIGAILFPIGAYFPGFTLTAGLSGATYGLALHQKPTSLWRIMMAVSFITLVLHLGLDTLWLQIITHKGFLALIPARVLKTVIMLPIQVVLVRLMATRLLPMFAGRAAE